MSLNWDISGIDRKRWDWEDDNNWPITDAFIWMTLSVDMGTPSEDEEEWVRRVLIWEQVFGPSIQRIGEDSNITPAPMTVELIRAHAPIKTNVTNATKAQFDRKVMKTLRREIEWELRK